MTELNTAWLVAEHNRLHNIELWPDSARKVAALKAAQSALQSLLRRAGTTQEFTCFHCGSKKTNLRVMEPRSGISHARDIFVRDVA
jgi:hypothetical protein